MIPRIGYAGRITVRLPSEPRLHLARETDDAVWLALIDESRAVPLAEAIVPVDELTKAIETLLGPRP